VDPVGLQPPLYQLKKISGKNVESNVMNIMCFITVVEKPLRELRARE
jgi:hypothetical protein